MDLETIAAPALTHVGLLTDDVEGLVDTWQQMFLVRRTEPRPTWYASDEGVLATFLPFPGGSIEPVQPLDQGTMQRRLFDGGTRAFHLSLRVPEIHAAVGRLRQRGTWAQLRRPGRTVTLHRGWVDPSSAHGTTIELIDETEVAGFRPPVELPRVEFDPLTPTLKCVGLIVDDLRAAHGFYSGGLGFAQDTPQQKATILGQEVDMLTLEPRYGASIELVGSVSPTDFGRRLGVPTPGIAYVGFESTALAKLAKHIDACEAKTAEVHVGGTLQELWIHPESTGGVAVRIRPESPTQ